MELSRKIDLELLVAFIVNSLWYLFLLIRAFNEGALQALPLL
jgi:hypothetical protein